MFLRIICVLLITGWFPVSSVVPVPSIYRKAELALNHYMSSPSYNPIIHSLLNVLIHVKRARAFISDEAIDMALNDFKVVDQNTKGNNVQSLRQIIYGKNCKKNSKNCTVSNHRKINPPSQDLKQRIVLELDKFFEDLNTDYPWADNVDEKTKTKM